MKLTLDWNDFKQTCIIEKNLRIQYIQSEYKYRLLAFDDYLIYTCNIEIDTPANNDQDDFETNYKNLTNGNILERDSEGKIFTRAESRPLNCTTYFTSRGDSESEIGKGKILFWDFSSSEDDLSLPSGSTEKRKRLKLNFIDPFYLKGGKLYYQNAIEGSYIDLYVVCPEGEYYLDNNGNPILASEDTKIAHFVVNHFMLGNVSIGDKLSAETCSEKIPATYELWLEITVPDNDETSVGYVTLEMFRERTIIL